MSLIIDPFQEFLVQKNDKTLWYYQGMYSIRAVIPASDRLAPTTGYVDFDPDSFSLMVQTPLDDYQAAIEEDCRVAIEQANKAAWSANASGRCDEDYTLEAIAFFLFKAPQTIVVKTIEAVGVLLDIALTDKPTTIDNVVTGVVASWFAGKLIKYAVNLDNDWVVEICSQTTLKVLGALPSRTDSDQAFCFDRRDQIYAFRARLDKPNLQVTYDYLNKKQKSVLFVK
jgi:hypothetical protein